MGRAMTDSRTRSTEEVFEDHLRLAADWACEEDIERNYARDVTVIAGSGVWRGPDGVQACMRLFWETLRGARFTYRTRLVAGEMAFLKWEAHTERARVVDGADSFIIRDGRIVGQTIHYTVELLLR
jgi:hypothetical protein